MLDLIKLLEQYTTEKLVTQPSHWHRRQPYSDRIDAGDQLADAVAAALPELQSSTEAAGSPETAGESGVIVLALPRGGVPVGARVADRLAAALDVAMVRKLGLPGQPELAMGALAVVGSGQIEVIPNDYVLKRAGVTAETFEAVRQREEAELRRRERDYRGDRSPVQVGSRTVIVVDDGLATGSTMRAAVQAIRGLRPARIIVAVPIAAEDSLARIGEVADLVVCPWTPESFVAVGQGYRRFDQVDDNEVLALLAGQH